MLFIIARPFTKQFNYIDNEVIRKSEKYFYEKATHEIKMFTPSSKYKKISHEKEPQVEYV